MRAAAVTLAAVAVTLAALARGLPADTFYTGDPGVKLIAARNALDGPSPLEIPLPRIGGEPVPYPDPFFAIHDGHSHAVTSELFPIATAPLLAAFGPRGVYVLPALGLLAALGGAAWLGVTLDPRRSAVLVILAACLGTPLLFYGLEFWEHAPAAGLAALATCVFVRSARSTAAAAAGGGVLFGMAILLRPEAAWMAVAAVVAARWLPVPPGPRRSAAMVGGIVMALAPLLVYTLQHFGTLVTPHLAGNPAIWGPGWLERRAAVLASWFVRPGPANAWITAPVILVSLVPVSRNFERHGRAFLAALAGLAIVLTVLSAPNDGGGQWGPRYLLPVFVPLAIVAADVLQSLARRRGIVALAVLAAAVTATFFVQRMSYERLRGTKQAYGEVLTLVREAVPPGGYAVTDLWWLDQVAASATGERTFLHAPDAATGRTILRRLDEAHAGPVVILSSRDESTLDARVWIENTCYEAGGRHEIPVRSLVALQLERGCS